MSLSSVCTKILKDNNLKIAIAESCTGGMLSSEMVSNAGVSDCYSEGYITYSNEAKTKLLGVDSSLIEEYGAVSVECARSMSYNVRRIADADIGLSTTGIAGPGGGTKEKPVGLVYMSCTIKDKIVTRKYRFRGSRYFIRFQATNRAIKLLLDCLNKYIV